MQRRSGPQRCGAKPIQDDKVQGISWVFSPTPFAGICKVTECPLDAPATLTQTSPWMGNTRHDFHLHNAEIEQLPLKQSLEASNYAAAHLNMST
jgi:hypothetical protein